MSSSLLRPHLLLISLAPKTGGNGSNSDILESSKKRWEAGEDGLAVQLGVDWEEQILVDDNIPTRKVPIVHIDCSNISGTDFVVAGNANHPLLSGATLAKKIAKLPGFQLLILTHVNNNEIVDVFMKGKVPLMLSFNQNLQADTNIPHFYDAILAGESLQDTFVKLVDEHKIPLYYQEFSIDPIQKTLKWDERKLGDNPDWTNGLIVRRLDKHRLTWRLKNPEFVKKDSFGLKSLNEVVADLSVYSPDSIREEKATKEEIVVEGLPKPEEQPAPPVIEEPKGELIEKDILPQKEPEPENTFEVKLPEPIILPPKEEEKIKEEVVEASQQGGSTTAVVEEVFAEEKIVVEETANVEIHDEPAVEERNEVEPMVVSQPDEEEITIDEKEAKPILASEFEKKAVVKENLAKEDEFAEEPILGVDKVEKVEEDPKEAEPVIAAEPVAKTKVESRVLSPGIDHKEQKGLFPKLPTTEPDIKKRRTPKMRRPAHEDLITPNTSFIPPQEKNQQKPEKDGLNGKKETEVKEEKKPILSFNKAVETKERQKQEIPKKRIIKKPSEQKEETEKEPTSRVRKPRQRVNKEKTTAVANPVKGPKHKKRMRTLFGLGGIGGIILLMGAWFFFRGQSANGIAAIAPPCPFPTDEGEYKILITPFHKIDNCGVHKEELAVDVIRAIQRIKKQNDLRISVRYQADVCLENEQAESVVDNCHADLVLGGSWRQGVSEGETHLQMYYVLAEGSEEEVLVEGKGIRKEIHGTETLPASSILMEDVKNFVFWAAAMRSMKRGYYDDAVTALKKIEASRPEMQSLIVLMMTKSLVKGGHFQQAISYFDQLIDEEPTNEKYYLERGIIRSKMGWPQKALEDFDVVMSLAPENTQAPIHRSRTLSEMGRYQEALSDIESLINKFDQLPELYMTRAEVYQKMGKLRDAQLDYENAIGLDPNNADAYVGRAMILKEAGDMEGAKAAINQALSHEASHSAANIFGARLLEEQGRASEALDEVEIVISRYPSPEAYFLRATLFEKMGEPQKALKDYVASSQGDASNIQSWIAQGRINLDQGKTQKALNAYQRAIDLRSGEARLFCLRGEVYTRLKRYNEAEEDYNEALGIAPNYPKALTGRALLYLRQEAYSEALADANKALNIDPKDPQALIVRGRIYTEEDKLDKAFDDFKKAISIAPELPQAFYYQGIAHMESGDPQQAERDFDQAVSLGGAQLDAYLFLGDAALESGDAENALSRYNEAVAYAEESPEPYRHRAEYYMYQNELDKALEDYNKLIELQGEATAEDYLKRGELHLMSGSRTQAMIDFNQAIILSPKWVEAYCTRGDLYRRMGRGKKALEDYNKASEADPQSPLPYLRKADLYMQLDEDEAQAFESVEMAINLSPNNAVAYNKRGELFILMEKPQKALQDFQKALSLDSENADVYTNLGNEAKRSGRLKDAYAYFSKAILLNPRQGDALYQRGFLKYLDKSYSSAIIDLETSIKANPQNGLAYGTLAKIYAARKQDEKMFYYLELALQHKYPSIELSFDPVFKAYGNDDRMKNLIESNPQ